jgi:hypothetical protein
MFNMFQAVIQNNSKPMKKSIFNSTDNHGIIKRIKKLKPDSTPEWGKMTVSRMMAHCGMYLHAALGDLKLKRSLLGALFGRSARKRLSNDDPFERNLPTDKQFVIRGKLDFEDEKKKLIALVQRLADSRAFGITREPHPTFGKLTPEEWDILIWKHLDHHLKQFGV